MYKRALAALTCVYLALFGGILFLTGRAEEKEGRDPDGRAEISGQVEQMGIAEYSSSARRVVNYLLLSSPREEEESGQDAGPGQDAGEVESLSFSGEEIEVLQRIVEAEAGGEDSDGKLLVANVVLNRVKDETFPDTISGVVFQKAYGVTQFSPVASGSFYRVTVSEETVEAVGRALSGEDISEGALYFAAREYADSRNMRWFDDNLTFLFKHGGHEFFR